MNYPKSYMLLLTGLGVSSLGNWIYLIALNLSVWHLTQSPAAVAGIYIVGPIARIICSFFVGSFIDRHNKKQFLIWSDIVRGILVCIMPFFSSIWLIYSLIFFANVASSFFGPSSNFMITKIVKESERLRFNAINSILSSGCFMIGPALGGAIIAFSNTSIAMWTNGITFFLCAWVLSYLPNVEDKVLKTPSFITPTMIRADLLHVWHFIQKNPTLRTFFIVFNTALMIAYALDSQEMTFLIDVQHVSDSAYAGIVSLTGIGAIFGGFAATALVKRLSLITYIGAGFSLTLLCYFLFYTSQSVITAVIAFVALGLFMAFSNTGYATLYQKSIPTELMGRFGSIVNLFQSVVQISFTLALGMFAEWISVQLITSIFAFFALLLAIYMYVYLLKNKENFRLEEAP